jgi:hypothetical protein
MFRRMRGDPYRKDEPEKPFWISLSDMMTGLMVLFLVSTAIAFVYVSHVSDKENKRNMDISACMKDIHSITERFPGVTVNQETYVIDFGTRATFAYDKDVLSGDQENLIQSFIPQVLSVARTPTCKIWIKQIVVNGFASKQGQYLYNLDLSFKRAERILCILLRTPKKEERALSDDDRFYVATRFFPGGSSSNSLRQTDSDSRRIEIRIEFLSIGEGPLEKSAVDLHKIGTCPLT